MSGPSLIAAAVAAALLWTLYVVLYRLRLSPLAQIPGPTLAGLTSLYEMYYDIVQPGQYMWKIQAMHRRYGPIVRVAPNEVHVADPEFLEVIYAGATRKRDKYEFYLRSLPVPLSMGCTVSHALHRRRRDALSPFFSKRAVLGLEPVVQAKCRQLARIWADKRDAQAVFNLSDLYYAFSNDIVVEYSFGRDDDLLRNEGKAAMLRKNISELLHGVKINQHFPWVFSILNALPFAVAKHIMPPGALDMHTFSTNIQREITNVLDRTGESQPKRSIFHALRDNETLPPNEKTPKRIEDEATLLVMAGTESVASTIATAHFYLLRYPDCMAVVRSELHGCSSPPSYGELEKLPYLTGVILESLRLAFGLTARLGRVAPDEALRYGPYVLPPGTPISSIALCIHTDETTFPDPWTFEPRRWLGPDGAQRRKYLMSFNKGSRSCLGINLAYMEMYVALATAASFDMSLFETDESDVRVKHDFHAPFPKLDSKGVRATMVK